MNTQDPRECKHNCIDGCFDDILCTREIIPSLVDGKIRPYLRGCFGICPDFTPKTEKK